MAGVRPWVAPLAAGAVMTARPKYKKPPVVEVALGVQFLPLAGLTSGHLGRFWAELGDEWPTARNGVLIPDAHESFGKAPPGWPTGLSVQFTDGSETGRIQVANKTADRMVQLQPTRLHYNWRKVEAAYPHYDDVAEGFFSAWERLRDFAGRYDLGAVVANQWELTYIDLVPKGTLWSTPAEWHEVFPGLFPEPVTVPGVTLEARGGSLRYEIGNRNGRLYVSSAVGESRDAEQGLYVNFTARGPLHGEESDSLRQGLELGHQAIGQAFELLASEKAKEFWEPIHDEV